MVPLSICIRAGSVKMVPQRDTFSKKVPASKQGSSRWYHGFYECYSVIRNKFRINFTGPTGADVVRELVP